MNCSLLCRPTDRDLFQCSGYRQDAYQSIFLVMSFHIYLNSFYISLQIRKHLNWSARKKRQEIQTHWTTLVIQLQHHCKRICIWRVSAKVSVAIAWVGQLWKVSLRLYLLLEIENHLYMHTFKECFKRCIFSSNLATLSRWLVIEHEWFSVPNYAQFTPRPFLVITNFLILMSHHSNSTWLFMRINLQLQTSDFVDCRFYKVRGLQL